MKSEFLVRPAIATDIPRLMGMDHAVLSECVWQLTLQRKNGEIAAVFREVRLPRAVSVPYPRDPFALADVWKRGRETLVAVQEEAPVGYVRFFGQESSGAVWVTDFAVLPETRRRGVAISLLRAAEDWALTRGYEQIFLEIPSKNHPAISLARRLGFEFSGYNDHYYQTQDVALFFGKKL